MPELENQRAADARNPRMSVILATDCYETIRPVVQHLRRQTVQEQLELVVVAPAGQSLGLDQSELEGFAGGHVVLVESLQPLGAARAAGVRVAQAPLVFIGETHTYPHPTWAEALIEAHARPWAAVAPGFGNANPSNALSWALFLLDYGEWLHGLPPRETVRVPTHNSAYKRSVLLELGSGLERALTHGDELTVLLRAGGHRSFFEPTARLDHLNVAQPTPWIQERFLGGLLLGARRAKRWSVLRRLVYFCGSPLIPVVLLKRVIKGFRLARREGVVPAGTLPALMAGTVISAIGEMVGYAGGGAHAAERGMLEFEVHKVRYASRRVRAPR